MYECSSEHRQAVQAFLAKRLKIMQKFAGLSETSNFEENQFAVENSYETCVKPEDSFCKAGSNVIRYTQGSAVASTNQKAPESPANEEAEIMLTNHGVANTSTNDEELRHYEGNHEKRSVQFSSEELFEKCSSIRNKQFSDTGLRYSELVSLFEILSEQKLFFVRNGLPRKLLSDLTSLSVEFLDTAEQYFVIPILTKPQELSVETVNLFSTLYKKTKKQEKFLNLGTRRVRITNGFLNISQNLLSEDFSGGEMTQFLNILMSSYKRNQTEVELDLSLLGNVVLLCLRRISQKDDEIVADLIVELYQTLPNKRLLKFQLKRLGLIN